MFIKWKTEHARRGKKYFAYLAHSVRIEGKPRQKIVAYLGSIGEWALSGGPDWVEFWYKAHCALCLAQVDRTTYQKTVGMLAKRVKCPTQEELAWILQSELEIATWRIERKIKEQANWMQKRSDLSTIVSLSQNFFDQ